MANIMAASSSNGFETESQGRAQNHELSERGPATRSKALPRKSFEPIGRHARIVRVTLQDCRLGRLRGPPPRNVTLRRAWPLPASHVEARVLLYGVKREGKSAKTGAQGPLVADRLG